MGLDPSAPALAERFGLVVTVHASLVLRQRRTSALMSKSFSSPNRGKTAFRPSERLLR